MPAGKMSELENDLGRRGDAPILHYIIGLAFRIGTIRASFQVESLYLVDSRRWLQVVGRLDLVYG